MRADALLSLQLSQEAQQRLGLETVPVIASESVALRYYAGDVIAPAQGASAYGRFPSATATDLMAMSQAQIDADAQVQRALTQRNAADVIYQRTLRLLSEDAGSVLERDRAKEQVDLAQASLQAARAQRELLGPAMQDLSRSALLWLRVPVFSGDLPGLDLHGAAQVAELGAQDAQHTLPAMPVQAPPSGNVAAGSVDLYYALPGGASRFRIGQKIGVRVPGVLRRSQASVPWSAIVYDVHGGEWVYTRVAPQTFQRQRVQVASVEGSQAFLSNGPAPGAHVVAQGAAELFGVEFGVAH